MVGRIMKTSGIGDTGTILLGDIGLAAFDAGSVSLHAAFFDRDGRLIGTRTLVHEGRIGDALAALDAEVGPGALRAGTSDMGEWGAGMPLYDARLSLIEAAKAALPAVRSILHVGAERFFLIRFQEDGAYRDLKANSSCAAGTGGFLDQQARRLSLSGSAELGERAARNMDDPGAPEAPRIASRCSVFAKTDLIHAQQEGFGIDAICEGLCRGLAATIGDTVFSEPPPLPLLLSGGVSLNRGVVRAMAERLGSEPVVPEGSALLPAVGAGLLALADLRAGIALERRIKSSTKPLGPVDNAREGEGAREEKIGPLSSDYPDFTGKESSLFTPSIPEARTEVEATRYADWGGGKIPCLFGIDVGSTSTKAVITDAEGRPLAGFYTRTAGRPLEATRALMEAAESLAAARGSSFDVRGAAATGSGRKFVGTVIGADLILDEITAHAAAAVALDPETDTIIEIGGQDAKFTTLRNGTVTFSRMNSVCAAGTGSFLEEQAQKLGVSVADYASRAMGATAPLASDRCTVFMERDINYYLSKDYGTERILAAALCSVRENYLLKVADEAAIGTRVCFQGATARNPALVSVFEGRLGVPIRVSPYCHLAGALGALLTLIAEDGRGGKTAFRGLSLWKSALPQTTEICELCRNHCRIRVIGVDGDRVAFGHLCGREDGAGPGRGAGADPLIEERRKASTRADADVRPPVMGLPDALQGVEEAEFWKRFFGELGIPVRGSADIADPIARGKKATGAEFCAPITAFHGHVAHIAERADAVFLPVYLERKEEGRRDRTRKYCYYTQFSAALVKPLLERAGLAHKAVSPLFADRSDHQAAKAELWRALQPLYGRFIVQSAVENAYEAALLRQASVAAAIKACYKAPAAPDIAVALLGRPYTVLSPSMNNAIPRLFAELGVKAYYQDMLPAGSDEKADEETERLLDRVHWSYASIILRAAEFCARTDCLYPVFITSFKCAPDSIIQEYLARIMERAGKPYLVLQLDEHGSNVGYATRIEAATRSFRNHARERAPESRARKTLPVASEFTRELRGKTVFLPPWDPVSIRLLAASMRHEGFDAHMIRETPDTVAEGLKTNSGQCIPVNVIAHEYAREIRSRGLEPERAALWMIESEWACNIGMYPAYIKGLLEREGLGGAGVYVGDLTMIELGPVMTARAYFSYLLGGMLHKLVCRVRPYERSAGMADAAARKALDIFEEACEGGTSFKRAAREAVSLFKAVPRDESGGRKPKAAIFGDLYLRDNPAMNQDLIRSIEEQGGEVVIIPYTEYTKIVSAAHFKRWIRALKLPRFALFRALLGALSIMERGCTEIFGEFLGPGIDYRPEDIGAVLAPYGVRLEQEGETYDNLLKVRRLVAAYPDIALFVHTSPAFCCPSLVTEALAAKIEETTGVPVVNIIYDGTKSPKNGVIAPYLAYPRGRGAERRTEAGTGFNP
jgi:predicted CoA-substrate-specific enzyme activase